MFPGFCTRNVDQKDSLSLIVCPQKVKFDFISEIFIRTDNGWFLLLPHRKLGQSSANSHVQIQTYVQESLVVSLAIRQRSEDPYTLPQEMGTQKTGLACIYRVWGFHSEFF